MKKHQISDEHDSMSANENNESLESTKDYENSSFSSSPHSSKCLTPIADSTGIEKETTKTDLITSELSRSSGDACTGSFTRQVTQLIDDENNDRTHDSTHKGGDKNDFGNGYLIRKDKDTSQNDDSHVHVEENGSGGGADVHTYDRAGQVDPIYTDKETKALHEDNNSNEEEESLEIETPMICSPVSMSQIEESHVLLGKSPSECDPDCTGEIGSSSNCCVSNSSSSSMRNRVKTKGTFENQNDCNGKDQFPAENLESRLMDEEEESPHKPQHGELNEEKGSKTLVENNEIECKQLEFNRKIESPEISLNHKTDDMNNSYRLENGKPDTESSFAQYGGISKLNVESTDKEKVICCDENEEELEKSSNTLLAGINSTGPSSLLPTNVNSTNNQSTYGYGNRINSTNSNRSDDEESHNEEYDDSTITSSYSDMISSLTNNSEVTSSTITSFQSPTARHLEYLASISCASHVPSPSDPSPSFLSNGEKENKEKDALRSLDRTPRRGRNINSSRTQSPSHSIAADAMESMFSGGANKMAQPSQQSKLQIEASFPYRRYRCRNTTEAVALASEQSNRLDEASALLIDLLFEYLHKFCHVPPVGNKLNKFRNYETKLSRRSVDGDDINVIEEEKQKGLTLPASAIGWLASRLYPVNDIERKQMQMKDNVNQYDKKNKTKERQNERAWEQQLLPSCSRGEGMEDRLLLLRHLLAAHTTHLRVTGDTWPPPLDGTDKVYISKRQLKKGSKKYHQQNMIGKNPTIEREKKKQMNIFRRDNRKSHAGSRSKQKKDDNVLTFSDLPHSVSSFLDYYEILQNQPRIDMAIFPNLSVLCLDGVAPSWVKNLHLTTKTLSWLKVQRGCIYDITSFLSYDRKENRCEGSKLDTWKGTTSNDSDPQELEDVRGFSILDTCDQMANEDKGIDFVQGTSFPFLKTLKLSYCGIGELTGLCQIDNERKSQGSSMLARNSKETSTCEKKNMNDNKKLKFQESKQKNPPLSLMKNLESLNLSHNEIIHSTTALAGLAMLPKLSSIDLSHNKLTSMENAFLMLGNIKTLILSGNKLTSCNGLDRLYSLERLALDRNQIRYLPDVSGIANLPELMRFEMKGNPLERDDPVQFRINMLNLFRESRYNSLDKKATYRQLMQILPRLDGCEVTKKELIELKQLTFVHSVIPLDDTEFVPDINRHSDFQIATSSQTSSQPSAAENHAIDATYKLLIPFKDIANDEEDYVLADSNSKVTPSNFTAVVPKSRRRIVRCNPRKTVTISEASNGYERKYVSHGKRKKGYLMKSKSSLIQPTPRNNSMEVGRNESCPDGNFSSSMANNKHKIIPPPFRLEEVIRAVVPILEDEEEGSEIGCESTIEELNNSEPTCIFESKILPEIDGEQSKNKDDCSEQLPCEEIAESVHHPPDSKELTSKCKTIKLCQSRISIENGATVLFTHMQEDTSSNLDNPRLDIDNKIKEENGSMHFISDGSISNDVIDPIQQLGEIEKNVITDSFDVPSDKIDSISTKDNFEKGEIQDMPKISLEGNSTISGSIALTTVRPSSNVGDAAENVQSSSTNTNINFPEVWDDESSLSITEALSRDNKVTSEYEQEPFDFASAEEQSTYDGPAPCGDLFVLNFIELYFRSFVFPSSSQNGSLDVYEELNMKHRYGNLPRIQLYQSDRDLMMWILTKCRDGKNISLPFEVNNAAEERFISVTREDVLSCGIAATARLSPTEKPLRGFHGEFIYEDRALKQMSETRKVMLCISNSAVYFISDFDQNDGSVDDRDKFKRKFPSPLPSDAKFKDGLWPHAISRHPLKFLQKITIGFGFQRLTLLFKLPGLRGELYIQPESEMINSFTYTYIVFTCNKHRTIELLQILQSSAKEASPSGRETLYIENDDRIVLDALGAALAPNPFDGVVIHYQVLRQRWMHGDRDAVRRVCVLTDDQIYLLHESYVGDTLSLDNDDSGGERVGEVAMNLVNSAKLVHVLEICAADEDPRLITLVIKAPSRLRRSHRWRLACNDGESAERLIDDVRKATAACKIVE